MTRTRAPSDLPDQITHDERYRVLMESAPDAIVTIDEMSCILSVNPATTRIFGWSEDELVGKPLSLLMPERLRARHEAGMARYLRTREKKVNWARLPLPGLRRNGTEFPMEVSFGEFGEGGRHIFSGFMRDVSDHAAQQSDLDRTRLDLEHAFEALEDRVRESEEARRAADQANLAKDQFLRTMSHELRTPLNAIGGFANLLEIGVHGPLTDAQREDLGRIQGAQVRLLTLVNDVLNFSKLEQGRVSFDIHDVPVATIVRALQSMVGPLAQAKHIEFECDTLKEGITVRADEQKLEQVMLNLLANAIKFTPEGGHVSVACRQDGSTVCLSVCDTGPGIHADRQNAVFEPFVQVDASYTRAHEGSGLGLSISRELAEGMGGTITLESSPGRGSEFTVTLPAGAPLG